MRKKIFGIAGLLLLAASVASAQGNGPTVAGVIDGVNGRVLVVRTTQGDKVSVTIAPDQKIGWRVAVNPSEIKPTDFVAASAVEMPDGRLRSERLSIFEGSFRGLNESRVRENAPRNAAQPSMTNATVSAVAAPRPSMTNATVASAAASGGEVALRVQYPGAEKELVIPAGTRVVRLTPVDVSAFKPGLPVTMATQMSANGLVSSGLFVYIDADLKEPRP